MLGLYVDSADREAAEPLLGTGLFRGMTTNPTLLQRASLRSADLPQLYRWATAAGAGEVFFQAWGDDADELVTCAHKLQDIGPAVVIKVPATQEGATAAARLVADGHRVLLTAVYRAAQGLVAAAAGAHYVAPYLGRMSDAGMDGPAEVARMHRAISAVGATTEVMVASLRDLETVVRMTERGISCYALAPAICQQFFAEPLTDQAVAVFEAAAREVAT